MPPIKLTLHSTGDGQPDLEFEARDVAAALAIADINVVEGTAELALESGMTAAVTKLGGSDHAPFWRVDR